MKNQSNNMSNKRSRNFFLVSYLTEEEIMGYCHISTVRHFAFIKHDKDVNEDGSLKEPHFHILIVFHNARTLSAVKSDFANRRQNTLCEVCEDVEGSFDYLTHRRHTNKVQYLLTDIISDDIAYFKGLVSHEDENRAFELVNDIICGKSPLYLLRRYGREYVINRNKYYEMANIICDNQLHNMNPLQIKSVSTLDTECPFGEYHEVYFDEDGVMREREFYY